MSKTAYSTYASPYWKLFKRAFPKRTERDFCEFASRLYVGVCARSVPIEPDLLWDRASAYVDNVLEFLWRFRSVQHFFLAPGVAAFCADSVKEFSEDYCKRLPACVPVAAPCTGREWAFAAPLSYFGAGGADKIQGGFAIHFPATERQRSVMVIPDANLPVPPNAIPNNPQGLCGILKYYFVASDGENNVLMQTNSPTEFSSDCDDARWIARLVFGLSLYMDAFPDAVVNAGAESIHQIKHYEGKGMLVARNYIIDEEHTHSISPHWRRGHFRLLRSEKFVHKHGQTVYVRGAFVKGAAFDVLDDVSTQSRAS